MFDFKRWSMPLTILTAVLFVGAFILQLQVSSFTDMNPMLRGTIEVSTTVVLFVSFLGGLLLVLFNKISAAEEKNGGEIPLPDCACCVDTTTELHQTSPATALASDIVPLNQIEVR